MTDTKKLALDVQFLQDQYYRRGIGRYGREITSRIIRQAAKEENIELHLVGFGDLEQNLELLDLKYIGTEIKDRIYAITKMHSIGKPSESKPIRNLTNFYLKIVPLIKKINPDLFFASHFERGVPTKVAPAVVFVHDAIPLKNGKFSSKNRILNLLKGLYYRHMWGKLKHCKAMFTPTEAAKRDVTKHGKLPKQKLIPIHSGVSDIFVNQVEVQAEVSELKEESFLLYDAGLEANKNVNRLLEIFSAIHEKHELKLVITGDDFQITEAGEFIAKNDRAAKFAEKADFLGISKYIQPVGKVGEQELVWLFRHAVAYINLSQAEGFGFGPLQAMFSRTPAIIANNPVFREVSAAGALVVTPSRPEEAIEQIDNLLSSEEAKQEQIKRGWEHVQKFTWHNTFQKTWSHLKPLLNNE